MADYTSQFTGSQIDARLAKVPQLETALAGKQATLVSGENIATINNQSLLEGGNITVGGGGGDITVDSSLSSTSTNPVQNKVINTALGGKQDTISDLATIRSGAEAGATAVQPSALSAKQDVLVSGTNIKTINTQSLLGSGNITIQAGDTDAVKYTAQTLTSSQQEQSRTNIGAMAAANGVFLGDVIETI